MREYRASAGFLVFPYSLITFLTLGGLAVFMLGITATPVRPVVWFLPLGLGLLAWVWSVYLHIPFIITYRDDRTLELKSFFRVVILSPGDIVALRSMLGMPWFLQVRHTTGKLVLTTKMTDMPELIALIQRENPAVQVSGV